MRGVVATPWTDEERAMLRRLRANGLGTVKISIMMGRSKSSITRQLKYLGLGVRNAPRPEKPAAPPQTPRRIGTGPTLPPLPSLRHD